MIVLNNASSTGAGCDLKQELQRVKTKIYQEFVVHQKPTIYDPDEFAQFCLSAGAGQIFNHILEGVTSERHSEERRELNKRRTVSVIYKMCYCLSQVCNVMQVDHALYLHSSNINQEGIDTEYQLGNSCCRKKSNKMQNTLANSHHNHLEAFFNEAKPAPKPVLQHVQRPPHLNSHTGQQPSTKPQTNKKLQQQQKQQEQHKQKAQQEQKQQQQDKQEQDKQEQRKKGNTYTTPAKYTVPPITKTEFPGVTEWLLPPEISQTRVTGRLRPSNACTIIASLCCRNFLMGNLKIPSNFNEPGTLPVNTFKQIIMTGNMLYSCFHLPLHQPNLNVEEVITMIKDLALNIVTDMGFFNAEGMMETFQKLLVSNGRQAGVLIIPPAQSVAVLAEEGRIAIFDSHEHGRNGGLFAVSTSNNIVDFLNYLGHKACLDGSNFSLLEMK